jgi:murein DD-endopeptidase MepM/ murein hydrolase activator NlpD
MNPKLLVSVVVFSLVGVRVLWQLSPASGVTAASASTTETTVVANAEEVTADLAFRLAAVNYDTASRSAAERARKVWPAQGGLTGWWAEPRGGRFHMGIDIDGDTGDEIYAMTVGVVSHAGPAPQGYGGYGNTVIIDHDGYQTLYAHLSRVDVTAGTKVVGGQIIGLMGTTGNVTGSHLHFEARVNGKQIDPKHVLPPWGSDRANG